MHSRKLFFLALVLVLVLPLLTACGDDGVVEEAADMVEDQMEGGTQETAEETEDETGDTTEETGDAEEAAGTGE